MPTKIERWLKSKGFGVTQTGGNCTGWSNTSRSGREILVASECGHKILLSDFRKGFIGGVIDYGDPVEFRTPEQLKRFVNRELKK